MREVRIDVPVVLAALKDATVEGWSKIMALDPPEQPYGLVLYEGAEYGYVCVSALTEEGLTRVADRYRSMGWNPGLDDLDHRESFRWSTPDSPFHVLAQVEAPPLIESDELFRLWKEWDGDDAPFTRYKESIRGLCKLALKELDAEGIFGRRREHLTLVIEDRDGRESIEETRQIVMELNPPSALDRYDQFLDALERARARQMVRQRDLNRGSSRSGS